MSLDHRTRERNYLLVRTLALMVLLLFAVPASASDIMMIGNSLMWGSAPSLIPGNNAWHIKGGSTLAEIVDSPSEQHHPTGTRWDQVPNDFDVLVLQPDANPAHRPTFEEDLAAAIVLADSQPNADIIIHTSWNWSSLHGPEFEANDDDTVHHHSALYMDRLVSELQTTYPNRAVSRSRHADAMYQLWLDRNDLALNFHTEFYIDIKHLQNGHGLYFAYNVLRESLGIGYVSQEEFENSPLGIPAWLDYVDERLLTNPQADYNSDRQVDSGDFLYWQTNLLDADSLALWEDQFGPEVPAPVFIVPEPFSLLLMLLGMTSLTYFSRNRG